MERARLRALTPFEEYFSMLRMFRRNGESPIKGIDTSLSVFTKEWSALQSRNGESPIKGIDTSADCPDCYRFRYVEMERARLRALTRHTVRMCNNNGILRRNGESPIKGIDTAIAKYKIDITLSS